MTPDRCDGRRSEERWFTTTLQECAPGVALEWLGIDQLDAVSAENPDLRRYLDGPYAQILKDVLHSDRGHALLAEGVPDLFRRNQLSRDQLDAISLHWTLDFAVTGNTHTTTLRPKYPDAARCDPVTLLPTFMFPAQDDPDADQVRRQLTQALDFGGSAHVPGRYVSSFDVDASEEVKQLLGPQGPGADVSFEAVPELLEPPTRGALSVVDNEGRAVATVPLYYRQRFAGRLGVTLVGGDAGGLLNLRVAIPRSGVAVEDTDHFTGLTIETVDVAGADLADVAWVVDLLAAASAGTRLRVEVGSAELTVAQPNAEHLFPSVLRLQEVTRALQRLRGECGPRLRFPREMTEDQAQMILTAVRLLDGEEVPVRNRTWEVSLHPDRVAGFLTAVPGEGQLLVVRPDAVLIAGDLEIPYGALAQWAPAVRLSNRVELERHNGSDPVSACFEVIHEREIRWLPRERAEQLAA